MISAELMYEKVMHRMDMTKETKEEELQEIIRTVLEDESKKEFIPLSEKIRLSRELFNAFRRLDILQDLIEDDSITEIMVNGTENIFYEKEGKLYRTNRHFFSESRLCDVIQQIVGEANRYVNETSPIVDARLADGSRVSMKNSAYRQRPETQYWKCCKMLSSGRKRRRKATYMQRIQHCSKVRNCCGWQMT